MFLIFLKFNFIKKVHSNFTPQNFKNLTIQIGSINYIKDLPTFASTFVLIHLTFYPNFSFYGALIFLFYVTTVLRLMDRVKPFICTFLSLTCGGLLNFQHLSATPAEPPHLNVFGFTDSHIQILTTVELRLEFYLLNGAPSDVFNNVNEK